MAEEFQTTNSDEREIDLIDLMGRFFSWCGRVFVSLAKLINKVLLWVFLFFYRTWKYYLIALLFVVALFVYKARLPKFYDCNMRVQSMCVNSSYPINLVNEWNYKMFLPDTISKQIRGINATYLIDYNGDGHPDAVEQYDSKAMKDTTAAYARKRMTHFFNINVELFIKEDSTILDSIKSALMDYLSNDSWIVEQNRIWQIQNAATIDRIKKEINILDSLQIKEYFSENAKFGIERDGSFLMISEKDKRLFHDEILNLLSKEQSAERYFYPEAFRVIQDFTIPTAPINTTMYNAKKSFILVLFFATILIFFLDRRKAFKAFAEKAKAVDENESK